MWKKLIGAAALMVMASMVFAQQAAPPASAVEAAPDEANQTVKKLIYVVQPNDTLWDISSRFLNSPYYWPKLWERNQFIINPKLIYPGDVINLYPESEKLEAPVTEKVTKPGSDTGPSQPSEEVKVVVDETGRIKMVVYQEIGGLGWIENGALEKAGRIARIPDRHEYVATYDHVYVDVGAATGVKEGDLFSVFEVVEQIRDPYTHKKLGYKIMNNGEIRITKLTPGAAEAEISHSYYEMELGDFIRPYVPPLSSEVAVVSINKKAEGCIVDSRRPTPSFAQNDIVYINLGKQSGIENGAMLDIYVPGQKMKSSARKGKKSEKIVLPEKIIGSLVVLDARDKTAVAMVTYSTRELKVGDLVRISGVQ
jgi:hypothetical protein